jgi:phosphatidylserine decarboxylase
MCLQDYHRWHAPISGTVESIIDIPGAYYTVNPQAINQPGVLNVFCENKRSIMIVRRSGTGSKVAIVAVGAMLVGSIFYVSGVDEQGAQIQRGQCLGGFRYGGSVCHSIHRPMCCKADANRPLSLFIHPVTLRLMMTL